VNAPPRKSALAVELACDPEALDGLSFAWEEESGCDSIDTIEAVYSRTDGGAYVCCFPGCSVARHDAAKLWLHVHGDHRPDALPPADFVAVLDA
jgi:hypothetical protein